MILALVGYLREIEENRQRDYNSARMAWERAKGDLIMAMALGGMR